MSDVVVKDMSATASHLASEIIGHARSSARLGHVWNMVLAPDCVVSEDSQSMDIMCYFAFRAVGDELVRFDFNESRIVPLALYLRDLLIQLIPPIIEGVGQVRCHETPEGLIVRFADVGQISDCHLNSIPPAEDR